MGLIEKWGGKIHISEKEIESIKLRDKKASLKKTILFVTLGIGVLYLLTFGPDGDLYGKS